MEQPPEPVSPAEDQNIYLVEENCSWFRHLIAEARPHLTSATDLFVLCLHALMIEIGLVSELSYSEIVTLSWRKPSAGHCSLPYRLNVQENTTSASLRVRLSVFSLGPNVTKVHGLCLDDAAKSSFYTTQLIPEEYAVSGGTDAVGGWGLKNVGVLARLFKNAVGWPLLQTVRRLAGLQTGGLLSLPAELKLQVLRNLDARSVVRLGACCRELDQLCRTESVWQRLVLRDFGRVELRSFVTSWREFYKLLVEEKRAQNELRGRLLVVGPGPSLIPPFDPDDLFPRIPPAFPGMVGGDYDIFPRLPDSFIRPRFDPPGPGGFGGFPGPQFGGPRPGFGGVGGGFGGFF